MGIGNIFFGKKVPESVRNIRLEKCRACPFYKKNTNSCGTPLIGGTVMYAGRLQQLCGCFSSEKTKYTNEKCPLNPPKWV